MVSAVNPVLLGISLVIIVQKLVWDFADSLLRWQESLLLERGVRRYLLSTSVQFNLMTVDIITRPSKATKLSGIDNLIGVGVKVHQSHPSII